MKLLTIRRSSLLRFVQDADVQVELLLYVVFSQISNRLRCTHLGVLLVFLSHFVQFPVLWIQVTEKSLHLTRTQLWELFFEIHQNFQSIWWNEKFSTCLLFPSFPWYENLPVNVAPSPYQQHDHALHEIAFFLLFFRLLLLFDHFFESWHYVSNHINPILMTSDRIVVATQYARF